MKVELPAEDLAGVGGQLDEKAGRQLVAQHFILHLQQLNKHTPGVIMGMFEKQHLNKT